jgi:hypothetical protein
MFSIVLKNYYTRVVSLVSRFAIRYFAKLQMSNEKRVGQNLFSFPIFSNTGLVCSPWVVAFYCIIFWLDRSIPEYKRKVHFKFVLRCVTSDHMESTMITCCQQWPRGVNHDHVLSTVTTWCQQWRAVLTMTMLCQQKPRGVNNYHVVSTMTTRCQQWPRGDNSDHSMSTTMITWCQQCPRCGVNPCQQLTV